MWVGNWNKEYFREEYYNVAAMLAWSWFLDAQLLRLWNDAMFGEMDNVEGDVTGRISLTNYGVDWQHKNLLLDRRIHMQSVNPSETIYVKVSRREWPSQWHVNVSHNVPSSFLFSERPHFSRTAAATSYESVRLQANVVLTLFDTD